LPIKIILNSFCCHNQNMENNIKSWSDIKDSVYGEIGTQRRDELEREFESLKIGLLLRQAREKKAITQEELGALVNKKRSYISRVENDASNITLKTLFDIVEKGLGAKLHLEIVF
jgi:ribosome-binding protein aMBF1 (putative translation factor)